MTKLTPQELDARIDRITGIDFTSDTMGVEPNPVQLRERADIKQLIRDCIEAVTPGKMSDYFGYHDRPEIVGYNTAIDTIEANTKELLGVEVRNYDLIRTRTVTLGELKNDKRYQRGSDD